jgi:hypothetical protein
LAGFFISETKVLPTMTDFAVETRHYCRNPRCRSKLKAPVVNAREAFCTRGCHSGFYRKRCLVCEGEMVRKTENQLVCGKRKCRNALQGALSLGRYHAPSGVKAPGQNPIKPGIKTGAATDRAWRIVAGAEPTASGFHCATVPDGPGCDWKDGKYERAEAANRALLREHFRKQAAECQFQPHHAPVNVLGGNKEYRNARPPFEIVAPVPVINLSPTTAQPQAWPPVAVIGDGLDIPEFLLRRPQA